MICPRCSEPIPINSHDKVLCGTYTCMCGLVINKYYCAYETDNYIIYIYTDSIKAYIWNKKSCFLVIVIRSRDFGLTDNKIINYELLK